MKWHCFLFFLILSFRGHLWATSESFCLNPRQLQPGLSTQDLETNLLSGHKGEIKQWRLQWASLEKNQRAEKISEVIQEKNQIRLKEFLENKVLTGSSISKDQAQDLRQNISEHPVVGLKAMDHYDPDLRIGFCFGRATFVHWELIRLGVNPERIVKIFAVGSLYKDYQSWDYHVATAVLADDNSWWVIDDLQNELMSPQEWMKAINQWSRHAGYPQIQYYFTSPYKFQPHLGAYPLQALLDPLYKDYFKDLMQSFKNNKYCQKSNMSTALPQ